MSKRFSGVRRGAQVLVLLIAALTMLGAGSPANRFNSIGHKLMCPCGCEEILLECNHVGCPDSDRMIGELRTQMASGLPDGGVLGWFANKYGPTVLAAPIRGGFDLVAWIVPFAVLLLGTFGVAVLLRLWTLRHARLSTGTPTDTLSGMAAGGDDLRERIRRETTWGE